jgi:hypothetical protein
MRIVKLKRYIKINFIYYQKNNYNTIHEKHTLVSEGYVNFPLINLGIKKTFPSQS